jgi:hypothetical protein
MTRKIIATTQDGDAPVETGDAPVVTADFIEGGRAPNALICSLSCREGKDPQSDILTLNIQPGVLRLVILTPDNQTLWFERGDWKTIRKL